MAAARTEDWWGRAARHRLCFPVPHICSGSLAFSRVPRSPTPTILSLKDDAGGEGPSTGLGPPRLTHHACEMRSQPTETARRVRKRRVQASRTETASLHRPRDSELTRTLRAQKEEKGTAGGRGLEVSSPHPSQCADRPRLLEVGTLAPGHTDCCRWCRFRTPFPALAAPLCCRRQPRPSDRP